MRILKGYSKEERKELEVAKKKDSNGALDLINGIVVDYYHFPSLNKKYISEDPEEDNQLAKDIVDFCCGNAKFPEQKYYVHLIKDDRYSYLNITSDGLAKLDNNVDPYGWKTKFTRDEVVAINPKLVSLMEDVEDNE